MAEDISSFLARILGTRRGEDLPPPLPLLEYVRDPHAADWLRVSLTTFAQGVASILPGHFEAYARIYHPFEFGVATAPRVSTWRELAAEAGVELKHPAAAVEFAYYGVEGAQAEVGRLPEVFLGPLVEHLRQGTTAPDRCFFAVWEGHGDLAVPAALEATLELPNRRYHLFAGPLEATHTSFSGSDIGHLSANLWWPADQAWCVATEIDFAWTYVGGPRSCIQALIADPRLEVVETTASAVW